MKRGLIIVAILSVIGIVLASYLTAQHYSIVSNSICHINAFFNCDVVNRSAFSEIFGIPVSILGIASYVLILVGAISLIINASKKKLFKLLLGFSGFGLLFSFYLTIVELFVLNAVCIFCLAQQCVILAIFLILFSGLRKF